MAREPLLRVSDKPPAKPDQIARVCDKEGNERGGARGLTPKSVMSAYRVEILPLRVSGRVCVE